MTKLTLVKGSEWPRHLRPPYSHQRSGVDRTINNVFSFLYFQGKHIVSYQFSSFPRHVCYNGCNRTGECIIAQIYYKWSRLCLFYKYVLFYVILKLNNNKKGCNIVNKLS